MIAFRSKAVSKLETADTSFVVTVPAGVQAGDVLLCWVYLETIIGSITPPAGWTKVLRPVGEARAEVFWRLAGGSEPGTYTFTFSGSTRAIATVTAYSGASPTLPLDSLSEHDPSGSVTTITLPARTAPVDNSWLLTMAGSRTPFGHPLTFTIDEASDAERSDDTVGSTMPSLAVYDSNGTVARGSVNDRVVTASFASYSSLAVGLFTELVSDETTGTGPLAYRGADSGAGTWTSTTPTATISLDASYVQDGDLLIVALARNQIGGTFTPPAGFTYVQFTPTGGVVFSLWYKIANNEPATLDFVTTAGSGSRHLTVGMVAYSGANTSSPIGAWGFNQDTNPTPTITTRTAGSWILSAIFKNSSSASFSTTDALDIERVERTVATEGGAALSLPLAMYDSAREYAAGSAVNRTLNAVGTTGISRLIVEIRPGIAVPTGPTVTFNEREAGGWTPRTAVPKAWTGTEWVEAPGRYWDGATWEELP